MPSIDPNSQKKVYDNFTSFCKRTAVSFSEFLSFKAFELNCLFTWLYIEPPFVVNN